MSGSAHESRPIRHAEDSLAGSGHTEVLHSEDQAGHGTLRDYVKGFVLAAILTAIPFYLVMSNVLEDQRTTALIIMAFAAVQIVVHMVYFLHMNTKSEGGWTMMALIFTMVLVVITLSGSLWIMYHLNANMMPMSAHDMRNMP